MKDFVRHPGSIVSCFCFWLAGQVGNLDPPPMKLCLAIVLATSCGCAPTLQVIHFGSDPPGARVYWGNGANEDFAQPKSFLGETPFDWTVELNGDHSFKAHGALVYSIFVPPAIVFEARPPAEATNLFAQRTIFHGGSIATGADKAPERIFFDLHQAAQTNQVAK